MRSVSIGRGVLREGITLLALLLMLLCGITVYRLYRGARQTLTNNGPTLLRAMTHDRLIGTKVALADLLGDAVNSAETVGPAIVWIVDLDGCMGCLDTVAPWLELEELAGYNLFFLMVGRDDPSSVVESRTRIFRRTMVMRNDRNSVFAVLGPTLASTKLLLDSNGFALLVDSRSSGQACGWSFEAQVGALLGLDTADRIRKTAASH